MLTYRSLGEHIKLSSVIIEITKLQIAKIKESILTPKTLHTEPLLKSYMYYSERQSNH